MGTPNKKYFKNLLIAFDQLLNSVFFGWADETLSSRSFRWERDGVRSWTRKLIDALFFLETCHCHDSYISEKIRAQMPPELRDCAQQKTSGQR